MNELPASPDSLLPEDVTALRTLVLAERAALAAARAEVKAGALLIEKLRSTIAKLKHHRFGASAERTQLLADQLELELAELGEGRAEAETRVEIIEQALPARVAVKSFERRKLP